MTETESMVERVAKAIRDTNANTTGLTFTELSHAMARAAIEAMKEPTAEMVEAGNDEMQEFGIGWYTPLAFAYRRMIVKALEE